MPDHKVHTVIGLMSGTSLDGVDAALIRTDGLNMVERLAFVSIPYEQETQANIRRCLGCREDKDGFIARTEIEITRAHAGAVDWLLARTGLPPADIDLIGFHGQTIAHDPAHKFTWQIGNGPMLARLTGIDVINDFRSADVAAGGQGAPLIPLYHAALAAGLAKPLAILNIGGVANVTYLGPNNEIIAFDTGPGNALLNDWVKKHLNRDYDENGMLARQGKMDEKILEELLAHPYFAQKPPKSLDRDAFAPPHPGPLPAGERGKKDARISPSPQRGEGRGEGVWTLGPADGAATLSAFTVQSIAKSLTHFPHPPAQWLVTGGGRHNAVLMEGLRSALNAPVESVDSLGWDGDALEAEGFGYLAVRSLLGLPLSLPATTGVSLPLTGGILHKAPGNEK